MKRFVDKSYRDLLPFLFRSTSLFLLKSHAILILSKIAYGHRGVA